MGLSVAGTTMLGGSLGTLEAATIVTDSDILNFALNLEYLEGEFYSMASYGATLAERGIIPHSAVGGPTMVKKWFQALPLRKSLLCKRSAR